MPNKVRAEVEAEHAILSTLLSNFAYDPSPAALAEVNAALEKADISVKLLVMTQRYAVVHSSSGDIYVCFRGTADCTDYATDLAVGGSRCAKGGYVVHFGIKQHAESLERYAEAEKEVLTMLKANPESKVLFVGHSLGGATAQLRYVWFLDENPEMKGRALCCTFGSPLFADRQWRTYCESNGYHERCYNFVNELDMVPPLSTVHGGFSVFVKMLSVGYFLSKRDAVRFRLELVRLAAGYNDTAVYYEYMGNLLVLSRNWSTIKYVFTDPTLGKKNLPFRRSLNAHLMKTYLKSMSGTFKLVSKKALPRELEKTALVKAVAKANREKSTRASTSAPAGGPASEPAPKPTAAEVERGLEDIKVPPALAKAMVEYMMRCLHPSKDPSSDDEDDASGSDSSEDGRLPWYIDVSSDDDGDDGGDLGMSSFAVLSLVDKELESDIAAPFGGFGEKEARATARSAAQDREQSVREVMLRRLEDGEKLMPHYMRNVCRRALRAQNAAAVDIAYYSLPQHREQIVQCVREVDRLLGETTTVPESIHVEMKRLFTEVGLLDLYERHFLGAEKAATASTDENTKKKQPSSPTSHHHYTPFANFRQSSFDRENAAAERLFRDRVNASEAAPAPGRHVHLDTSFMTGDAQATQPPPRRTRSAPKKTTGTDNPHASMDSVPLSTNLGSMFQTRTSEATNMTAPPTFERNNMGTHFSLGGTQMFHSH